MRSLDVIILKNAEAAGRELAHAHNDAAGEAVWQSESVNDQTVLHGAYAQAEEAVRFPGHAVERAFTAGWNRGKQEG